MTKLARMKTTRFIAAASFVLTITFASLRAQTAAHDARDITGQWQGTLELGRPLRIVLKIAKAPDGTLTALNYSIDQGPQPTKTSGVSLDGHTFKYSIPSYGAGYEGQLSTDGNMIIGKWAGSTILNFARVTKETAWEIPTPPAPLKPMTELNPSFQVATIKPVAPNAPGKYIRVMGRKYTTHGTSLADLIQVAYGVNAKQILGAPSWAYGEKYDLVGEPDAEGEPSGKQWLIMMQKLLTERFSLKFHHEQRDVSSYVLTVSKDGPKHLDENHSGNPLPSGLEFRPIEGGLLLPARNTAMSQFAQMMQQVVLDRPVVDHTNLQGHYDFELRFMPDETMFNGHPPMPTPTGDAREPSLTEALQQQLGIRLSAEKVSTDMLIIDQAQKPSPN